MWVDAFSWFDGPGRSGGKCVPGAPGTAVFWPAYAAMLVANRVSRVTGPYFPAVLQNGLVSRDPRNTASRTQAPLITAAPRGDTGQSAQKSLTISPSPSTWGPNMSTSSPSGSGLE